MSTADAVSDREADVLFAELIAVPAVILAVSGGPDSVALLALAARWRRRRKRGPVLTAVTIDHGLRPEAKREAAAVKRLARDLGVAHRTLRWIGAKPSSALQEQARRTRYRLLAKAARAAGARHILIAHTLDDQAETVLFRMARGSGVAGLGAMAPRVTLHGKDAAITVLRPLLRLPKARLLATLHRFRLPFVQDPSNADPRFARVRFRALLSAIAEEGIDARRLAILARRMSRANAAIEIAVDAAQACTGVWPSAGPVTLPRPLFFGLPGEVALRLLGRAIGYLGREGPVELGKLEDLMAALAVADMGGTSLRRTLAGAMVTISDDNVAIVPAPARRTRGSGPKSTANRPRGTQKG